MGLQLIFCVETNPKTLSDWIYIREILNHFYPEKFNDVVFKFNKVFLCGKGNYDTSRVNNEKKTYINQYKSASTDNVSKVIYVFDTDDYDLSSDQKDFLTKTKEYCDSNGYEFVWFCKDIERVLINKKVEQNQKKKVAEQFKRNKCIKSVDKTRLNCDFLRNNSSNILCVLDRIFKEFEDTRFKE